MGILSKLKLAVAQNGLIHEGENISDERRKYILLRPKNDDEKIAMLSILNDLISAQMKESGRGKIAQLGVTPGNAAGSIRVAIPPEFDLIELYANLQTIQEMFMYDLPVTALPEHKDKEFTIITPLPKTFEETKNIMRALALYYSPDAETVILKNGIGELFNDYSSEAAISPTLLIEEYAYDKMVGREKWVSVSPSANTVGPGLPGYFAV